MQTRKDEKYEVLFANTNRLKNGSIITMQNMLNTNAEKTWGDYTDLIELPLVLANYDLLSDIDCKIPIAQ